MYDKALMNLTVDDMISEVGKVIYMIDDLKRIIAPIAAKYGLFAVYVFGSYARNEATENSDIDILIDRTGSKVKSLIDMGALYDELCENFDKKVDLLTTYALTQDGENDNTPWFTERVMEERIVIYEQ